MGVQPEPNPTLRPAWAWVRTEDEAGETAPELVDGGTP